jgi:HTH-type transcriptional regulator/antitoxin HigA
VRGAALFYRARMDAAEPRTPGQLIEELLAARGWSRKVLATVLGKTEGALGHVISGRRTIDAELALQLGSAFEVPPERFLTLQATYDLAKAKLIARENPDLARRARLFTSLPIQEMEKRGWIEVGDVRDFAKVESALCRFFGVDEPGAIPAIAHAAKRTGDTKDATPLQAAWIHRVQQIARTMVVEPYAAEKLREHVGKLRALLTAPEDTRHVPKLLAECGVRFVVVEALPSGKIDGVCLWLDDGSPVVGMSLRFDRIDNFWFVLRHEIEHVLQRHGRETPMLDAELEGESASAGDHVAIEERIANAAALDFCVPTEKLESFIVRKQPLFSERDLLGFAKIVGVHPGLVAGQLRARTQRWNLFSQYVVKVRQSVLPSARVDGWGQIAPVA